MTWTLIGLCAVVTAAIKAAGPIALGGRELPRWAGGVIGLMAPALLSALLCVSALADGKAIGVGADTAGVACGAVVLVRGANVIVAVLLAAVVTALIRAV
jgi:branched-subunit amino acid transport protein